MVLVVLVVVEELVVFVGGIFKKVQSQNFSYRIQKEFFGRKQKSKILKTMSKIHLNLRVLHSLIPLLTGLQ